MSLPHFISLIQTDFRDIFVRFNFLKKRSRNKQKEERKRKERGKGKGKENNFFFREESMGCGGSKKETATVSVSAEPKSEFDARLAKGLQRYSKEMEAKSKGGKIVSFNQVILKFRKINNALKTVKAIFEEIGGGQTCILHDDCVRALAELGDGGLSEEKLAAIFHEADIFTHGKLSLKEFTLCICMGYVLGDMKLDNATTFTPADAADAKAGSIDRKSSRFFTSENELREAFDVIIGCYLLFDADGTGDLDKGEVLAMMEEKKGAFSDGTASNIFTKKRWEELDFDNDGQITFKEFTWALLGWIVEAEDGDEADEADETEDAEEGDNKADESENAEEGDKADAIKDAEEVSQ